MSLEFVLKNMQFDEILRVIGEFGPYQAWIYILLCLPCIFIGMHSVNTSFILYVPFYRCKLPKYQNDTYEIQSSYHAALINETIPLSEDKHYTYDQCHFYTGKNRTVVSCSEWVYDQTVFTSTFVTEQNIVCGDDKFEVANIQLVSFIGETVGGIIMGPFSDWIGRKIVLFISILLMLGTTLGISWAPNKAVFIALKIIFGIASEGVYDIAFILGLEVVGPSKRVMAAIGMAYFDAIGLIILPGLGYWLRDWFWIEIAHSAPIALFLFYVFILPESPRWLISKGRRSEANEIVFKIATSNKTEDKIPPELENMDNYNEIPQEMEKICNLFKSSALIQRSLILFFNWLVVNMAFYGLSLSVNNLAGDFYLNFFLVNLVDLPAYTVCLVLLDRVGRKKLYVASMTLGGIALICTVFTTQYEDENLQLLTLTLSLIGKLGVSAGYGIIYLWTAEIFPTSVRNSGIGCCSVCAGIGSIFSPYIADLNMVVSGNVGQVLPLVVFGASSFLGGLMTLVLPETLNLDLPETIQEAVNVGKDTEYEEKKLQVLPSVYEITRF